MSSVAHDTLMSEKFDKLKSIWGLSSLERRRTLSGKSGASIYLVEASGAYDGYAILKIFGPGPASETAAHKSALKEGGVFADLRFPKLAFDHGEANWSAVLMTVAGDGLKYVDPISVVAEPERVKALGQIVDGLLLEWNKSAKAGDKQSGTEIVLEWLGEKLKSSRLIQVYEELTGLDCAANEGFRIGERDFPNPVFACRSPKSPLQHISLSPITGYQHGDLHGGNILVHAPRGESKVDYYVIDFEYYRTDCPILFDIAYFELAQLLSMRQHASQARWLDLIEVTARLFARSRAIELAKHTDDVGMIRFAGQLRDLVFGWQKKRFKNRQEDIERQYRLACIAAGLNFGSKRELNESLTTSQKLKEFALLYAAQHLKQLYEFEHISLPKIEPVQAGPSISRTSSDAWREAWSSADNFNQSRNAFILIVGPTIRTLDLGSKAALARLPWSLAVDFDRKGDEESIFVVAKREVSKIRGFHHFLPNQTGIEVNFSDGIAWLMADGWEEVSNSVPQSIGDWRRRISEHIRILAAEIRSQVSPRPITIVVLAEDIEAAKLRGVYSALNEKIDDLKVVVLKNGSCDFAGETLKEEGASTEIFDCSYHDFAIGVSEMIGDAPDVGNIRLPAISEDSKELTTVEIQPDQASLFAESLELVHDGLAIIEPTERSSGPSFSEGAVVSWQDLNRNLDVARDLTTEMRTTITNLLNDNRTIALTLMHKPGAGATTIARRLAWDFHNLYPTTLIKSYNNLTADHIESIYQITGRPLLVIVERANILGVDRERFFNELRERHIRFVFVDVIRSTKFQSRKFYYLLEDQLVKKEAKRFRDRYWQWCIVKHRPDIERLTADENLRDFRSPFFYNLYSFENNVGNIKEYVRSYFEELSDKQREIMAFLALIGAYSQHWLPYYSLNIISERKIDNESRLSGILGESASKLVLFNGSEIKVVHPLIAKEILRIHLGHDASVQGGNWKDGLTDFCVSFLDRMAHEMHQGSEPISNILTDLFVSRTEVGGTTERDEFSDLVLEILTDQGRRIVLEKLCSCFPSNPHYWNHLGRLINFKKLDTYDVAEKCYQTAIALDEDGPPHHHGLGMVYRAEVRDRMWPFLRVGETSLERLESVVPVYQKAEEAFARARELDPTNEYPRISQIQMITRAIEDLLKKSGCNTYPQMLAKADTIADWSIRQLSVAQRLMDEVRHINAEREPNRITVETAGKIDELFGNFETMVVGLVELLNRGGIDQAVVRRSLARCYLRQAGENLSNLKVINARHVAELVRENLRRNPRNGADLRMWFQAFRLLPEFTIDEAIERFSAWAQESNALDAWYYLYILHFLNVQRGVRASIPEAKKYIERCRKNAPELISKRSFEWIAAEDLERPCPLLHHSELGAWKPSEDLFAHSERLCPMKGTIVEITRGTSGKIDVDGLKAFFAPGRGRFSRASDLNTAVTFYLGFSYEGLRAWNVQVANN